MLVAASLAAYRLALLITSDTILRGWRRKLAKRYPPTVEHVDGQDVTRAHPLVEFVHCGRCVGVWTAGLVLVACWAVRLVDDWRWVPLGWPAVAGAVVLCLRVEP